MIPAQTPTNLDRSLPIYYEEIRENPRCHDVGIYTVLQQDSISVHEQLHSASKYIDGGARAPNLWPEKNDPNLSHTGTVFSSHLRGALM